MESPHQQIGATGVVEQGGEAAPVVARGVRRPPRRKPTPEATTWVDEVGGMARLLGSAVTRTLRPPVTLGPEFTRQILFVFRISWFPLILTSFALSFGPAGVQASGFLGLFGALDRLGAAYELIVVREFAPLVSAIVLAGVAGTAICADLGARVVRDETAALETLGVDVVKSLVAPRIAALFLLSILFNVFSLISGMAGAVVVVAQNHEPLGPFFATFFANATPLELGASFVKAGVYGVMIGVVCCYKGMNVSGGPEGVGRAVNQSVVVAFLAIGAIDYVFTQLLLATNPILSQTR